MPLDPACQAIANTVNSLDHDRAVARTALAAMAPEARWKAFGPMGTVESQLSSARAQLEACVEAHPSDLEIEVVLFDTMGTSATPQRTASLWIEDPPPPSRVHTTAVVNGRAVLVRPAGTGSMGLTVEVTSGATVDAVDFRSDWLHAFPWRGLADPDTRLEAVLGSVTTLTPADLDDALVAGGLPIETQVPVGAIGSAVTISIAEVHAIVQAPRIHVRASGTAQASGAGALGAAPFSVEVPLELLLGPTPDPAESVDVRPSGSPTLEASGPLAPLLGAALPWLADFVARNTASALEKAFAENLQGWVATQFALAQLPPGAIASVRSVAVSSAGINLQTSVGAFGTLLSTFVP